MLLYRPRNLCFNPHPSSQDGVKNGNFGLVQEVFQPGSAHLQGHADLKELIWKQPTDWSNSPKVNTDASHTDKSNADEQYQIYPPNRLIFSGLDQKWKIGGYGPEGQGED
jgi:hypothetical protein